MNRKPLGGRSYGSIAHLPGSRRGPADHGLTEEQARMVAHGTRYVLPHSPFVLFDLRIGHGRARVAEVTERAAVHGLPVPRVIHEGPAVSVADVLAVIEPSGHGALDPVEGAVWRCERHDPALPTVLGKYVTSGKIDGCYLASETGQLDVLNTWAGGWS